MQEIWGKIFSVFWNMTSLHQNTNVPVKLSRNSSDGQSAHCVTKTTPFWVPVPLMHVFMWTSMWIKKPQQQCSPSTDHQVLHQMWIWGIHCVDKQGSMRASNLPWLWNPGSMSPEAQNRGIIGPTKRAHNPSISKKGNVPVNYSTMPESKSAEQKKSKEGAAAIVSYCSKYCEEDIQLV